MPKLLRGVWLPDEETYLVPFVERGPLFAGKGTMQFKKFAAAIPYIKDFRHAVDIGAHCGLWSRVFARCFSKITAFEPFEKSQECFELNVPSTEDCNVTLHRCALGASEGNVTLKFSEWSTAKTKIALVEGGDVPRKTLDSFALTGIDFIKIDTEGFEQFVIQGGKETIQREKPTMIIEQKPNNAERFGLKQKGALEMLKSWGAIEVFNMADDHCVRWK